MSEEEKQEVSKKESHVCKKDINKVSNIWVISTDGKPSISATFAVVAFFATTAAYVASIFESIGSFSFRTFDTAACGAYMVPILSLYFGRRWAERTAAKKED